MSHQPDSPEIVIARFLGRLQWTAVAAGVVAVLWLLAPVLTPFVCAAMLGWLGDPLVDGWRRAAGSATTA